MKKNCLHSLLVRSRRSGNECDNVKGTEKHVFKSSAKHLFHPVASDNFSSRYVYIYVNTICTDDTSILALKS